MVGISKPLDSERKKQRKKHVSPFIAPGASAQLSGGGSGEEPSVPKRSSLVGASNGLVVGGTSSAQAWNRVALLGLSSQQLHFQAAVLGQPVSGSWRQKVLHLT